MAMAANGLIRATRAVDFVVASDEENIARLRAALRSVFDDPSIEEIDAAELAGAYPVVQYFPPGEAYSVDNHRAARGVVRVRRHRMALD